MSRLSALLTALELTGGARIVLRSDERPHVIVGDTRHELGTAQMPTTTTLETLADQILSPAGKQALAEQRVAVEALVDHDSVLPVRVMVRRIGTQMLVELQRDAQGSENAHPAVATAERVEPIEAPMRIIGGVDAAPSLTFAQSVLPSNESRSGSASPLAGDVLRSLEPERSRVLRTTVPGRSPDPVRRQADLGTLDHLIRQAVGRKATALYLRGGQAPIVRVGARMEPLGSDPVESSMIAKVTATLASPDELRPAAPSAVWVRQHEGIHQTLHAFADARGPGLVVRLASRSPESLLQRDIPRQVKRACEEDDGLVIVAAPSATSVLSMIAAVGNWTAGRRGGYLISIEPPGGLEHEITGTFASTRTAGGGDAEGAAAIRQAAGEAPDVLVVASAAGSAAEEALRAARPGCLVVLGVIAPTAIRALESLLTWMTPRHEAMLRQALASTFRCAFSYRALHTPGGGRKVVWDLLTATPDVRLRLERGDVGALETLQRAGSCGMRSLDMSLASAVIRGDMSMHQAVTQAVDGREVVRMIRQYDRDRRKRG
jgi:Tfp pilus assembly pilus retraction ATPase PilT